MRFLLVSEKQWNKELLEGLMDIYPQHSFQMISSKEEFTKEAVKAFNPDKIFIPHWSYIIPKEIYESYICIIFHMTDLPFGRGGSPLQNLIVRGFTETKITALRAVKDLDAGPVYLKKPLSLYGNAEEIFLRANGVIKKMIIEIIERNPAGKEQEGQPEIFSRRKPEMSNIKDIDDLQKLYDHIRMLDAEGYPKAYIETESFRLEFSRAALKADKSILADVRIIKK